MSIIPLLNLFVLLATVDASTYTYCDQVANLIDYNTPESNYNISMTAETGHYDDCEFDQQDLKKMLLGSDDVWRSSCKKAVYHTLVITPLATECKGSWYLHHFRFSLKNAKKVEVFVDDVEVFSQMTDKHFTLYVPYRQPGTTFKIVAYSKWRCITFSDVQVHYAVAPTTTVPV